MNQYSSVFSHILNTDGLFMHNLESAAGVRPEVVDIIIGSRNAGADYACSYEFRRTSGASVAGTATTKEPCDPGSPASECTVLQGTFSTPPTAGNVQGELAGHQRASLRWVKNQGYGIILPATDDVGLGIQSNTPSTAFNATGTVWWIE